MGLVQPGAYIFRPVAERAGEQFVASTTAHEMTVLHDEGPYRHIRFAQPGHAIDEFDLVTWPEHLAMISAAGEWVFTRVADLFDPLSPVPSSDPYKWADKCTAHDEALRVYDPRVAEHRVRETLDGWIGRLHGGGANNAVLAQSLRTSIATQILIHVEDEYELRAALDEFTHAGSTTLAGEDGGARASATRNSLYAFDNVWDWDLRDFDFHFSWACHAIAWGVECYRSRTETYRP